MLSAADFTYWSGVLQDSSIIVSLAQLDRLVLLVLLRLTAGEHAALPEYAQSGAAYGNYLYDNWLLDVPKLLDVAALYANEHRSVSVRAAAAGLLRAVFTLEPRYGGDLMECMASVATVRLCLGLFPRVCTTADSCAAIKPCVSCPFPRGLHPCTPQNPRKLSACMRERHSGAIAS